MPRPIRRHPEARAAAGGPRRPRLSGPGPRGRHRGDTGRTTSACACINVNAASLLLDGRQRAARRQEQSAPALSRHEAHVPLRLGRRRAERPDARRRLQGQDVFVGTTALGTREVVATPIDTLFAGVEVQATVADNLAAAGLGSTAEYESRWRCVAAMAGSTAVFSAMASKDIARLREDGLGRSDGDR